MRNLQVFILVAMALMLFMAGATAFARRARKRRVEALQAAGDAKAVSRLENEGGHFASREHTS